LDFAIRNSKYKAQF